MGATPPRSPAKIYGQLSRRLCFLTLSLAGISALINWNSVDHLMWIDSMRQCGATGSDKTIKMLLEATFQDCSSGSTRMCPYGPWSAWSACDRTCNAGRQRRTRDVHHCKVKLEDSKPCWLGKCDLDCKWHWGSFGACTKSCGNDGEQIRTRVITQQGRGSGKICPSGVARHSRSCNKFPCPTDCILGPWGPGGPCRKCEPGHKGPRDACVIAKCGVHGAMHLRYRAVKQRPSNGGKACAHRSELRPCGHNACPVDCIMGSWGSFGTCSATCTRRGQKWGLGERFRSREITQIGRNGGLACTATRMSVKCRIACSGDCRMSKWSQWTSCTQTCHASGQASGSVHKTRRRHMTRPAMFGGKPCPKQVLQTAKCVEPACPQPCQLSPWSAWSACSKTCHTGRHFSTHKIIRQPRFGGAACPSVLKRFAVCNVGVPCVHSTSAPVHTHMSARPVHTSSAEGQSEQRVVFFKAPTPPPTPDTLHALRASIYGSKRGQPCGERTTTGDCGEMLEDVTSASTVVLVAVPIVILSIAMFNAGQMRLNGADGGAIDDDVALEESEQLFDECGHRYGGRYDDGYNDEDESSQDTDYDTDQAASATELAEAGEAKRVRKLLREYATRSTYPGQDDGMSDTV